MLKHAIIRATCALLLAAGCSNNASDTESTSNAQEMSDAGAENIPEDSGATANEDIGKACGRKADCGSGLFCLSESTFSTAFDGYLPHGLCTKDCDTDADCGDDGYCEPASDDAPGTCVERCKQGPLALPDATFQSDKCHGRKELACGASGDASITACFPSCGSNADCADGKFCSLGRGVCVDDAPAYKKLGDACSVGSGTNGCGDDMLCLQVFDKVGICTASCTWARPSDESCGGPKNGACLYPDTEDTGAGDFAYCAPSCSTQGDCLASYLSCRFSLGHKGCFVPTLCPNGHDDCDADERCVNTQDGPTCVPLEIPFGSYDECNTVDHYEACATTTRDTDSGLTWSRYLSGDERTYDDAVAYCADMLGGAGRLPTNAELRALLAETRDAAPYIDVDAFEDASDAALWTSSEDPKAEGNSLVVSFGAADGNAATASLARTKTAEFRCVRD